MANKKGPSGEFNLRFPNPDDISFFSLIMKLTTSNPFIVYARLWTWEIKQKQKTKLTDEIYFFVSCSGSREKYNEFKKKRYAELKASSPDSVRSPVLYPTLSACFTISLGRKPSFADHFFHILKTVLQRNAVISAEWKESKENPNFVNGEQEKKSGGKKWRMGVLVEREKEWLAWVKLGWNAWNSFVPEDIRSVGSLDRVTIEERGQARSGKIERKERVRTMFWAKSFKRQLTTES